MQHKQRWHPKTLAHKSVASLSDRQAAASPACAICTLTANIHRSASGPPRRQAATSPPVLSVLSLRRHKGASGPPRWHTFKPRRTHYLRVHMRRSCWATLTTCQTGDAVRLAARDCTLFYSAARREAGKKKKKCPRRLCWPCGFLLQGQM